MFVQKWLLGALLSLSFTATAEVSFQEFVWKADNRIEVNVVQDGVSLTLKSHLEDGKKAQAPEKAEAPEGADATDATDAADVAEETVTAFVRSYKEGFVTVTLIEAGSSQGEVIVLERQNANFNIISDARILGHSETLAEDVDAALDHLIATVFDQVEALAIRKMVNWFIENPGKNMTDFLDLVELGRITKEIPRPKRHLETPETRREVGPQDAPIEQHLPRASDGRNDRRGLDDDQIAEPTAPRVIERELPPAQTEPRRVRRPPPPPAPGYEQPRERRLEVPTDIRPIPRLQPPPPPRAPVERYEAPPPLPRNYHELPPPPRHYNHRVRPAPVPREPYYQPAPQYYNAPPPPPSYFRRF